MENEILAFIGSIIGAVAGFASAKKQGDDAKDNAREANEFTREQMQNKHQWEVADLRAAGLNPVLSAHGSGSIGGSAMASAPNYSDALSSGVNSAVSAMQLKRMDAEIKNIMEDTDLKKDMQTNQIAQSRAAVAQASSALASARKFDADTKTILTNLPAIASSARNIKTEQDTWVNRYIRPRSKAIADFLGDYTGAVGNIFRGSASHQIK